MRSGNCTGVTSCDATLACSATILLWRIWRQFKRRQNFAEKKPGPQSRIDQHCAFAVPADAGLSSMIALQNWAGIDIRFLCATKLAKEIVDLLQLRLHKVMIIVSSCVTRDSAGSFIILRF